VQRRFLAVLVYALPVLIVAFAVLMGGYGLAQGAGDDGGAAPLRIAAIAILVLLVVDLILLVGLLGMLALPGEEDRPPDDERLE